MNNKAMEKRQFSIPYDDFKRCVLLRLEALASYKRLNLGYRSAPVEKIEFFASLLVELLNRTMATRRTFLFDDLKSEWFIPTWGRPELKVMVHQLRYALYILLEADILERAAVEGKKTTVRTPWRLTKKFCRLIKVT